MSRDRDRDGDQDEDDGWWREVALDFNKPQLQDQDYLRGVEVALNPLGPGILLRLDGRMTCEQCGMTSSPRAITCDHVEEMVETQGSYVSSRTMREPRRAQ